MPSAYDGDNFVGVGGPDEGFWLHIVLCEEAVDRSLLGFEAPQLVPLRDDPIRGLEVVLIQRDISELVASAIHCYDKAEASLPESILLYHGTHPCITPPSSS